MTEGKLKLLLIRKKMLVFRRIISGSLLRNIFISLKYHSCIRSNYKLDEIIFKTWKYVRKLPTLHIYHTWKQFIIWQVGVNGQFSCWKRITMESHWDVFINDPRK